MKFERKLVIKEMKAEEIGLDSGVYEVETPIIGYKKVQCQTRYRESKRCIVTLIIPEGAKIVKPLPGRHDCKKLRANLAYVQDIKPFEWEISPGDKLKSTSLYDVNFNYEKGRTVSVPVLNDNIEKVCTEGIHFFSNIESAKEFDMESNLDDPLLTD